GIEALDRPLRGADAVLAGRRGNAGPRRQDADADGFVLRDGRAEDFAGNRQGANGGGRLQKSATGYCHGFPPTHRSSSFVFCDDDISEACQRQASATLCHPCSRRNESTSVLLNVQSLSRLAMTFFMKGSDRRIALPASPR